MAFITSTDFPASIRTDILDALTVNDPTVFTEQVERAIDEVRAYLNSRYDVENIFNKTGNSRSKYIVQLCLTIAVYYLYVSANPRKITQTILNEFTRATENTLPGIQSGKINPVGLPVLTDEDDLPTSGDGQSFQWGSDATLGMDW